MTLISIDTVLRKLQFETDIGSYNALFYELITLLNSDDFANDIQRYNKLLSESILPGEFDYNLHVEQHIHWGYLVKLRQELHYKFCFLLNATKPKQHASARERNFEYLTSCHNLIISVCRTLFDPEPYRVQLRYYDGIIYSVQSRTDVTNFPSLAYDHFIYRPLGNDTYHATKLDLLRGDHSSSRITTDVSLVWEFHPLYQHLWPELSV